MVLCYIDQLWIEVFVKPFQSLIIKTSTLLVPDALNRTVALNCSRVKDVGV